MSMTKGGIFLNISICCKYRETKYFSSEALLLFQQSLGMVKSFCQQFLYMKFIKSSLSVSHFGQCQNFSSLKLSALKKGYLFLLVGGWDLNSLEIVVFIDFEKVFPSCLEKVWGVREKLRLVLLSLLVLFLSMSSTSKNFMVYFIGIKLLLFTKWSPSQFIKISKQQNSKSQKSIIQSKFIQLIDLEKMESQQLYQNFVNSRLLYSKFDTKIQQVFEALFKLEEQTQTNNKMVDQSEQNVKKKSTEQNNPKRLTKEELLEQIQQLQFQNFKYRTALLSAKKDQKSNQAILSTSQQQIASTNNEVQKLMNNLEMAVTINHNKQSYNQLASSLKQYEPKTVQDQKIKQISDKIHQMQQKYQKELKQYETKQKCLKLALSALKGIVDWEPQTQTSPIVNNLLKPKANTLSNGIHSKEDQDQLQGGQIRY